MNERGKISKITKKNIKSIKRYMTKQKVLRFYQNDASCDWNYVDTALFTWNGGTGSGIG